METFISGLFFMFFLISLCHTVSVAVTKKRRKKKKNEPPQAEATAKVYYVTREQKPAKEQKAPDIALKGIIMDEGSVVVEKDALPPKTPARKKSTAKKR